MHAPHSRRSPPINSVQQIRLAEKQPLKSVPAWTPLNWLLFFHCYVQSVVPAWYSKTETDDCSISMVVLLTLEGATINSIDIKYYGALCNAMLSLKIVSTTTVKGTRDGAVREATWRGSHEQESKRRTLQMWVDACSITRTGTVGPEQIAMSSSVVSYQVVLY